MSKTLAKQIGGMGTMGGMAGASTAPAGLSIRSRDRPPPTGGMAASPYSITGGGSFILHYQGPDGKRKALSHHKTYNEARRAMRTHMRGLKKSVGGVSWSGARAGTHDAFNRWAQFGSGKRGDYGIMKLTNGFSVYHMPREHKTEINWVGHGGDMGSAQSLAEHHHTNPHTTDIRESGKRMGLSKAAPGDPGPRQVSWDAGRSGEQWSSYGYAKHGNYGIKPARKGLSSGFSVHHMPLTNKTAVNNIGFHKTMAGAKGIAQQHYEGLQGTLGKSAEVQLEKALRQLRKAAQPAKLAEGAALPENHPKYFLPHPEAKHIPIGDLHATHVQEKGIRNAEGFMRQAYNGEIARRKPITVAKRPEGGYHVLDGNSTFFNAKKHGWKTIPAVEGSYERAPGH